MRKMRMILSVLLVTPLLLVSACKEKENEKPTCEILNPLDGDTIMRGDLVAISVIADDPDGTIKEIQLYIDSDEIVGTEVSSLHYEWNTSEVEAGVHVVSALAADDQNKVATANNFILVDTHGGFNSELTYGTVTDIDGNNYGTIAIGGQTWMAENLRVTRYADGTAIPMVPAEEEWSILEPDARAYCWYENLTEQGETSGALYTWAAAMNGVSGSNELPSGVQGACPDGWHLPSDAEWKILEIFLGMGQGDADSYDWRGSDEGSHLKETGFSHWDAASTGGSNSSGFTALPGGFRGSKGLFYSVGQYATFWTATAKDGTEQAWYRSLYFNYNNIYRKYNFMRQGYSVRCVMDQ